MVCIEQFDIKGPPKQVNRQTRLPPDPSQLDLPWNKKNKHHNPSFNDTNLYGSLNAVLWIRFILIRIRIRIRGSVSDDYGSGSGSEVTLTLWILFSLLNVLQGYNSYKLWLLYIKKCKEKIQLTISTFEYIYWITTTKVYRRYIRRDQRSIWILYICTI